jgi:hypothetical protein
MRCGARWIIRIARLRVRGRSQVRKGIVILDKSRLRKERRP